MSEADDVLEGGAVKQQCRHGVQRVEPATGLVDGFADVVGLASNILEQLFVLERVVPLCHGHGARVEPAIGHVGDAAHGAVRGIFPGDFVDIGAVQVEVAERATDFGFEFGHRANTLAMLAIGRDPDGQRRAPVAFAADGPVDVVGQPVTKAPAFDVFGHPGNFLVGGDQPLLAGGGADIPAGFGVVEQGCFAAPTERIGVLDAPTLEEVAALLEHLGDDGVSLFEKHVGKAQIGELRHRVAVEVDREQCGQGVFAADFEVTVGGGNVYDAGTVFERHEFVGDDAVRVA